MKVKDLVLLVEDNCPQSQYPLALVEDIKKSRDGLVRSVRLRYRGKEIVRPITKIIFLESTV